LILSQCLIGPGFVPQRLLQQKAGGSKPSPAARGTSGTKKKHALGAPARPAGRPTPGRNPDDPFTRAVFHIGIPAPVSLTAKGPLATEYRLFDHQI
jgi:hypothetical protein